MKLGKIKLKKKKKTFRDQIVSSRNYKLHQIVETLYETKQQTHGVQGAVGREPEVKKLAEKEERPKVERRRPIKIGDGEEREELKDLDEMRDQGHDFAGITALPTQINP